MTQTNVRLKLLIDSKAQRVLYGEADKNFIDFLFNLLSLPLGAVIRLLKKEGMVGCLGNLYESIETLNETYLQPNQSKDTILKPKVSFNCSTKLLPNIDTALATSIITAPAPAPALAPSPFSYSFTLSSPSIQPITSGFSSSSIQPITSGFSSSSIQPITSGEVGGFVKDLATYIVMDDLTVKHISDFSITTLLKKFNIKEVDSLEEKVITLDVDEGVELLEASLQSKTVLTNVFLKRRRSQIDNDVKLSNDVKSCV